MPDIAVVVVAYQSAATLSDCLSSILADPHARVVVVDNAGDPDTREICAAIAAVHSDRLNYDDPGRNLGYAAACNRGLAALDSRDLVAVVNPDVALDRALSELAAMPEFHTGDVIAGRLRSIDSPASLNARPAVSMARELAKAIVGTRAYRIPALASPDGRVHEVDQLDGALLLLTAATWRELGGFDERFELYYEDVDLCARVRQTGRCMLYNSHFGSHVGGHSFKQSDGRAFIALRVSRTRFALKWWRPRWLAKCVARIVTDVEMLARSVTRQPEGGALRSRARRHIAAELREPGSQRVLANDGEPGAA